MAHRIPFNKPYVSGKEIEYVSQAVLRGEIAADGRFSKGCARILQERFGIPRVLMMPSCTAGLEMADQFYVFGVGEGKVGVPAEGGHGDDGAAEVCGGDGGGFH